MVRAPDRYAQLRVTAADMERAIVLAEDLALD
jgi:hypothetical protein